MKTIGIILKKELKRYFTDVRLLLSLIIPGILIFLLYSVMGNFMNKSETVTSFDIMIVNQPEEFKQFDTVAGWTITHKETTLSEALAEVKNKTLDLVITYEENFYDKMLHYDASSGDKAPQIEMYYNSASTASTMIYDYYQTVLNAFEATISNRFDINGSPDIVYDLANQEDITIRIFTMLLPFLLIIFLFTGCMGICSEAIAGEKERGTIATLLVTPVKRSHFAIGKIIALSITSLVAALASFIGLIASLPQLVGSQADLTLGMYGVETYLMLLVIIIVTVLFFTVVLTILSTFAKSVKEASGYAVPVMAIVMLVGVTGFTSNQATTNPFLYLVPVYNSVQALIGVLSLSVSWDFLLLTVLSNVVYIAVGIYVLTKMFNSEKIIFNK